MAVEITLRLACLETCWWCLVIDDGHLRSDVACVSAATALQAAGQVVDKKLQDAGQLRNNVDGCEVASDLGDTRREPRLIARPQIITISNTQPFTDSSLKY